MGCDGMGWHQLCYQVGAQQGSRGTVLGETARTPPYMAGPQPVFG